MLLEVAGFVGVVIVFLFYFAEQRKPIAGVFASLMLMVSSFWVLSDGLQMRSGEVVSVATLQNLTGTNSGSMDGTSTLDGNTTDYSESEAVNMTGMTNITGTETLQYSYADVPITPYAETSWFLGIMLLLFSLYTLFHYIATLIRI